MKDNFVRSIVSVAALTALIIVGAILSISSPWNPVIPFTMATFFVILSGTLLGSWKGVASVANDLFLGAVDLPVFAGTSGGAYRSYRRFPHWLRLGRIELMGIVEDWSWISTWGKYTAPFLLGDGVKMIAVIIITRLFRVRLASQFSVVS